MFDFGVPLEDVFPPNDVHPRLKYLFSQAYHHYIACNLDLDLILRKYQGSLQQRLDLKDKLVYEASYQELARYPCGSYFWLLRHFLGLLPIPLLPVCSKEVIFDWEGLSGRCKNFLKQDQLRRQKDAELIYIITENLSSLSPQHFLLVNVLAVFIRKVSQISPKNTLLSKKKLLTLARFFCGSIFNRPYRPGYETADLKMLPLALYILIRWKNIQALSSRLGHPMADANKSTFPSPINPKPVQFNPDVIPIYRNVPVIQKVYLRDESSQTEIDMSIATDSDENGAPLASSTFILETSESDSDKLDNFVTAIDASEMRKESGLEPSDEISKMRAGSNSRLSLDDFITAIDQSEMMELRSDCKSDCDATVDEFKDKVVETEIIDPVGIDSDKSTDPAKQHSITILKDYLPFTTKPSRELEKVPKPPDAIPKERKKIRQTKSDGGFQKTFGTVRKIGGYIYDDYETFNSENYNQVATNNKKPSILRKLSKKSLNYFSKTIDEKSEEKDDSYVNYDEIDSDYDGTEKRDDVCKSIDTTFNSHKTLWNDSESKSKATFNLKRFKINMDFLRMLKVPKDVKYLKIKNVKANTI